MDHGPSTVDYHYYHQDHIGSSNVITDESGKVAKLMEYSPYGLTTREEGAYNTNYRFTGKLFDTSTALYYYGARYYDPELGRFIQPDTIVPYPDDPQSFNRYSYCRNNPITYIDPTGHAFWDSFKKWIGNIVGAIAGIAATIMSGGNVLAGFQVYSFASGMINAGIGAFSGDWSGVGAGIGGMVGSVFGWQAGVAGGALLSNAVPKFVVGAAVGAMEFGSSGFGAGFGGAIGGGSSFKDAVTSGLVIGGVSAIAGAIMEGSYMAGWQSVLHGATVEDIANAKRMPVQIGSRPAAGSGRHKFTRWKEAGDTGYRYWEMGPDASGNIMINAPMTHASTLDYINNHPNQVDWSYTTVDKNKFYQMMHIYEKNWAGSSYGATYFNNNGPTLNDARNSNFAVNFVIYGSDGTITRNLEWCPGRP